ncbi:Murein DD-endopeptidase MepM [compost metagenome]
MSRGVGGALIPAEPEDLLKLGAETQTTLNLLSKEIDHLKTSFTETKLKVEEKQQVLRITPTIWPIESRSISSLFGYRKDPFNSKPSLHTGLDIAAPMNEPVFAAADGTVISTGSDQAHGSNIVVEHFKGMRTWYMHLNKIKVNEGDQVKKGETIGLVGTTGRSTGPHLHYEVIQNGVSVDPKPFLQTSRKDEH